MSREATKGGIESSYLPPIQASGVSVTVPDAHLLWRILHFPLTVSLVVSLAVSFGTAELARAAHFLTHPAETASSRAASLFKNGTEIRIKKDANVYITSRNIPENDRLLEAYNADRVQTRFGEASVVPGLLNIANQAHRAQDPNGQNHKSYSLADAMRDAIWRKNTAARLKALTTAQNACVGSAGGIAKNAPSIGLAARC